MTLMRAAACRAALIAALLWAGLPPPALAATTSLEDMTWTELRERIQAGSTTVIVPIGGTEQSGPHMVLGKHNVRVRLLAARIAGQLGHTIVAPVIAYVPEGAIDPPAAHMRYAGTLTISDATFESLLDATARSLRQHGFRHVVFIGDHGGYQRSEERVAARLNREWAARPGCRVLALVDYYRVTQTTYVAALKARGHGSEEIGNHAGLADTALSLALDPALVRREALAPGAAKPGLRDGVDGDPRRATAELGQLGVDAIVATAVAQIKAWVQTAP